MSAAGLKHRFTLAIVLAATVLLAPLAAQAQIAFRNAASSSGVAPAFRAASSGTTSSAITFGSSTNAQNGSGSNSLTINKPSGVSNGDLLLAHITFEKGSDAGSDAQITPSGWTLVRRNNRGTDIGQAIFRRVVADAVTEPASYTWNFNNSPKVVGGILRYSGVDTSNPIIASSGNTGDSSTLTAPSVASEANSMLLALFGLKKKDTSMSTPTGMTERYLFQNPNDVRIKAADQLGPADPTGNRVSNAGSGDKWVAQLVALRPASNVLTIAKPAGTVQDDVMIASIGVRPSSTTITAPSGWTLVRRMDNGSGTSNSLAVYRRVAGASEPASYTWTVSGNNYAVGGIQSFSGIDTASPIDVENGQTTPNGTTHTTPSVTTTVAGAILVTSHTYSSNRTWSPPSGMIEAIDVSMGPDGAIGQALEANYEFLGAAGSTGTKSATAAGDADTGNAHILALRPLSPGLTIPKPAGTVAGDFMVAAIGVQDDSLTITPPSGWTLLRRMDQGSGTDNSLAIYTKAAGASEPATYSWAISGSNFSHAVGGIQSFSGVDTTNGPVNAEDGQSTSSSTSHSTPSIDPTVANTMLVTAHTFASSRTWTAPSGMTEAYDTASLPVSNSEGQSIVGSYQPHVFLATGTKTATVGGNSDTGNAHILALRPLPITGVTGGFNAYDTTTGAGATSGFIKTKIAGSTVNFSIIALNWPRTAIETGFTGTVRVEVLDASNNTGALDINGCRSSWTVLQTLSNPTFVAGDNGRKTVSFTQANSYKDLRVRVSYPTTSPTQIGCSNDNFAMRPDIFTFTVTDADWETAGTTRTLNNVAVPGGITHKAGRPFTVQATAINAVGAVTTNYDDTPIFIPSVCTGSACTATSGTFTLGAGFVAGVMTSNVATYSEVGSIRGRIRDSVFSNVDASDGSSGSERDISASNIDIGRFVPDNFAVALNTPSFGTACGAFTYVGQKFNYATAPVITLTARNFAGGTTTLYAGVLWQITNASLTGKSYTAATGTLDVSGLPGTDPVIFSAGAGTGTLTFGSGTGLSFSRTTPVAPFDGDIGLSINVIDADGISPATNPATFGTATPGNGIAFTSGKSLRFGRLTVRNANGSQLLPLLVPVEAQYWSGAPINGFISNTLDSCTTIASANDAMGNYTGNLSGSPTCETAIVGGGALSAGRGVLMLAAPGSGNGGSVDLTVNLGASASGSTCTTQGGAPGSATTANLPHLQGNWSGGAYDQNPAARATFGITRGSEEVVFVRENF